jgi:hypothetical protein
MYSWGTSPRSLCGWLGTVANAKGMNAGHGGMTNHRKIIAAASLLVTLAVAPALPATAGAGPLLSGYGGPGQGSQAILGSALLNGGSGGGGSAGSSAAAPGANAAPGQPVEAEARASSSSSTPPARAKSAHHARPAPSRAKSAADASKNASGAYIVAKRASDQPFLALSEGDVLGAIAVLAALVLTGFVTRHLARRDAGTGPPKGVTRRSRANG